MIRTAATNFETVISLTVMFMIPPVIPSDEPLRRKILTLLDLLDSAPEPFFDRITRLAAKLLDVPMATFSVIDSERQWFKSKCGLDIAETPREVSFCGHAILESRPMVVADARLDPRFSGNPLVTGDPSIRFYAGVPVRSAAGVAIGTLCAIGTEPKLLSESDLSALEDLAEMISSEIRDRERFAIARQLLAGANDPLSLPQEELVHLYIELLARADKTVEDLKLMSARLDAATQLQLRTGLELWAREEELRNVIENSSDAFISTTDKGMVTAWNRQAQTIFGWTAQEALGQELVSLLILSGQREGTSAAAVRRRLMQPRGARLEIPAVTKEGRHIFVELRSALLNLADRQVVSIFMHDISERKHTELQHAYEAEHDWLTGIPNRRALVRELSLTLSAASASEGIVALLFIDLDGFKRVNDEHGHNVGDRVLKIVTQRAASVLRKSDRLYRLGGDEFVVLMTGGASIGNEGIAVANRLINSVSRPISLGGNTLRLGASVGMAFAAQDGSTSTEDLISRADAQMYLAKSAGRGRVFLDDQVLNLPSDVSNA